MKLLWCPACKDIVALHTFRRECFCGQSWGKFIPPAFELDGKTYYEHAESGGHGVIFGIDNFSFHAAENNYGQFFVGWFYRENGAISREHIHHENTS